MHPERRFFPLQQQTTGETAIRTNLVSDLYLALGDADDAGAWTVRAYWKPLVPWIWIGAVIMAFGGVVSLSDRRWRVGVARARPPRGRPSAAARRRIGVDATRLLYLLPLLMFLVLAEYFASRPAARPRSAEAALGDDRQAGAAVRSRRLGRRQDAGPRRAEGPPGGDQFLRLLVRPLPDRASAADAPGRAGPPAAVWHRLQGQAGGLGEAAGDLRRSVPAGRHRPEWPGRPGFRRLWRAGNLCPGQRRPSSASASSAR